MTKQKKMMKITLRKKCYMLDNQFLKYSKKDKNSFYTLKPRGPNDRATFQLQVFVIMTPILKETASRSQWLLHPNEEI